MKKLFLLGTTLFLLSSISNAQTQKGWYLIGGNIGKIGATFQSGASAFNFEVAPKAAWFVRDNIAVGGQIGLGLNTAKASGTTFSYNVGPMARYYFPGKGIDGIQKTRLFAEANVGFGGENNSKSGISTNGVVAGAGPGIAYFVNENIALEALAKVDIKTGFGSSAIAVSPNIGVGFQIYLPTSKIKSLKKDIK